MMNKLAVLLMLVIVLLVSSCQFITGEAPAPKGEPEPAPSPESELPFKINISPSEASYLPGEEIMYGIGITNLSSGTITIDPFPPAERIIQLDQDKIVYSYTAGNRTRDIGSERPFSFYNTKGFWDQKDDNGEQVTPGWYELSCEYTIIEQNTSKRYTANLTARFQIVHPDSSMNKELDVNQSVTAEGLTATLERIEINAVEVTVWIFTTPPGYTVPQAGQLEKHSYFVMHSEAEYSVDGGNIKRPLDIRAQFNEIGTRLIWDIEPIPVDARELNFTVTQLGDWDGRWEFKVSLE